MKIINEHFHNFSVEGDIPNISFLVATNGQGLLYFSNGQFTRIIDDSFCYGITRIEDEWWVYFSGKRDTSSIVSFDFIDGKGYNLKVRIGWLKKSIHQIDFVNNNLVVCDTSVNQAQVYKEPHLNEGVVSADSVLHNINPSDFKYAHINSVFCHNSRVYLVAHNKSFYSGRKSEVFVTNSDYELEDSFELGGYSVHNFYCDDNKQMFCNSERGSLVCNDKEVFVCDTVDFTRGLAINSDFIVLGSSQVTPYRDERGKKDSFVYILDGSFNKVGKITIPNCQVHDIRRVDVPDLGLSNSKRLEEWVLV